MRDWRDYLNSLVYCFGCGRFARRPKSTAINSLPRGMKLLYQPHGDAPPALPVHAGTCEAKVLDAIRQGPVHEPLEQGPPPMMDVEVQSAMLSEVEDGLPELVREEVEDSLRQTSAAEVIPLWGGRQNMEKEREKVGDITLVYRPTVSVIAESRINLDGVQEMVRWLEEYRPQCLPESEGEGALGGLLPHPVEEDGRMLTDAEMLVELSGRKCYNSFGLKAGRKTNESYIAHTQSGDIPHASILYHPKMTFFLAGVSRRVSHELIRNYVGADRDEEGSPSQESTRYTHHPGRYVVPPRVMNGGRESVQMFAEACSANYGIYRAYIRSEKEAFKAEHGKSPKGMDRKRIFEAAAGLLMMQAETSWIWTTNPVAFSKLVRERSHGAADLEFQRFADLWRSIAVERWPNLFPQPWMQV